MTLEPPEPPKGFRQKLQQPHVWIPIAVFSVFLLTASISWIVWNWRVALVIVISGAILVLVWIVLRFYHSEEQEERLARGIYDSSQAQKHDGAPQAPIEGDLEASFRRALDDLRKSQIDDLYALPWLLVIGESGGGKSELIRQSGLDVPPEYTHTRTSGPTRDCDFWLTNQAIVLDVAGRYSDTEDAQTVQEWKRLLALLKRHRSKFPLEGIVVAVPITSLFGKTSEQLTAHAHLLRRRFNELQDRLGVDAPIYIVVTKADCMQGFVEFASSLPADSWQEALGWTNSRRRFADAGEITSQGLADVRERLESLLPEMLLREPDPQRKRRLILFPSEFEEATRALSHFLRSAFAPSVYSDEVPFLRGVYFTSAKREGSTLSPVLERLGHGWAQSEVVSRDALNPPLFQRGLFQDIIVGDRELAVRRRWQGRRVRRSIVWPVAGLSLIGTAMLGIALIQNFGAERRIQERAKRVIHGSSDLETLDSLRRELTDSAPQHIPFDGLWLAGNLERARERGRKTFNWAFEREFERPTKKLLLKTVGEYSAESFEALATTMMDVAKLSGDSAAEPDLVPYTLNTRLGRSDSERQKFRDGYDSMASWLPESPRLQRIESERKMALAAAPLLLSITELERWAKHSKSAPPAVRFADFGISISENEPATFVSGAYTLFAWESLVKKLVSGVERLGAAGPRQVAQFSAEYTDRFESSWRKFLIDTPSDPHPLARVSESPYLQLLEDLDKNTRAEIPRLGPVAPWIEMLREVRREQPLEGEDTAEKLPPWLRYLAQLEQVEAESMSAIANEKQALDISARIRDENSAFSRALSEIRVIAASRKDPVGAEKLQHVLSLPVLNGASAVFDQATDELDRRWVDGIVRPFGHSLDSHSFDSLYAGGGELDGFLENGAQPFYADGQVVSLLENRGLPLGPRFLAWMDAAQELQRVVYPRSGGAPKITVKLAGLPTRVQTGPRLNVSRTVLKLACENAIVTYEYRQGGGYKNFPWTTHCGTVTLQAYESNGGIERELQPKKEWPSFPKFVQDGLTGGNTLQWHLEFGGSTHEINYQLLGGRRILSVAHRQPPGSVRE